MAQIDLSQLISWAFQGLLGFFLLLGVQTLRKLSESVETLNERVATIIEKTSWHEKELYRLDGRVSDLEKAG